MAKKTTTVSSDTKYTVAAGNSYISDGIVYGPGVEIPASVFADADFLQAQVDASKIIATAPAASSDTAAAAAASSGAAAAGTAAAGTAAATASAEGAK